MQCSWKEHFGVECLTCGTQRSFDHLLNGELLESILMFPALLPLMFTVIITVLHLYFKWRRGPQWIVYSFTFTAVVILLNYIIKTTYLV